MGVTALDLPPLWTLGAVALASVIARVDPLAFAPMPGVAGVIAVAAVAVMLWAAITMGRAQTPVMPHRAPLRLVTWGPFRFSRNPIYLADLAIVLAAVLWFASPLSIALVPALGRVLTQRFIRPEEARLARLAPDAWKAYAKRTGRWLFI